MRRKAIFAGILILSTIMLAGCGQTSSSAPKEPENEVLEEVTTTEEETTTEFKIKEIGEFPTIEGEWLNIDNMQFSINGITYALGEVTLQDLIDDGVNFNEASVENFDDVVDANTLNYQAYIIDVADGYTVKVIVGNFFDTAKNVKDLHIYNFSLSMNIYYQFETQQVIGFTFPSTITIDHLKEKYGEPSFENSTEIKEVLHETIEYDKSSEVYYGSSGYKFDFANGQLSGVSMSYLP